MGWPVTHRASKLWGFAPDDAEHLDPAGANRLKAGSTVGFVDPTVIHDEGLRNVDGLSAVVADVVLYYAHAASP